MIFGNINNLNDVKYLPILIEKCFDYIENNNMEALEAGRHEIDGDNLFVNVCEYDTKKAEEKVWEAHKCYLDFHYVISGEERIYLNFKKNMKEISYDEKDDGILLEGEPAASAILKAGDFVIMYPNDVHKVGTNINGEPTHIKKAVFKISIK